MIDFNKNDRVEASFNWPNPHTRRGKIDYVGTKVEYNSFGGAFRWHLVKWDDSHRSIVSCNRLTKLRS